LPASENADWKSAALYAGWKPALLGLDMYTFLGHPSEELVQVTAAAINEVFIDAALALFDLMTDLEKIKNDQNFQVQLSSPERHLLLVDWLNHLILLHEVHNVFLVQFNVDVAQNSDWHLTAVVEGEKIRENHERRMHAKSATYGQLEWKEEQGNHTVRFVIDI
jgi:SHS2 domain-containing protein